MVLSALFFSIMSLLVKEAGKTFPTIQLVFVRGLVVTALAGADLLRRRVPLARHDRPILLLRGVFGLAALFCFYYAVIHLPLAEATVIHFTNPIWTGMIAAVFIRERLRPRELAIAAGCLVGVALVVRPFGLGGVGVPPLDPVAVVSAFSSALLASVAYVLVRRLRDHDAMQIVFWFAVVSVVIGLPAMLPFAVMPSGADWLLLAGVGVATFLGQVTLTHGLKRERAGAAMTVGYLQVVFAAAWGALLFGEPILLTTVAGAAVIGACILLLARARRRERRGSFSG